VKRPLAIDLFSGAGGLSLGFEQAGFDVKAAVEIDPIHALVHKRNFPQCHTICKSVTELTGETIREQARLSNAQVDVVFGGPPCQGFSMIGKRALDDPRNQLVQHFVRLVRELDASYFLFENVKGLTIGPHKVFLEEVIDAFERCGYSVLLPYQVLNAANFGVPQDRQRLFLLGCKKGLRLPVYPEHRQSNTVQDAIGDIPNCDDYAELIEEDSAYVRFGKASRYASALRGLTVDKDDYSYPRIYDKSVITSSMRTSHTEESMRRFAETLPGKVEPISRFLKLDPNGVCNTLRAGTDSSRGAFTSPRPIHPHYPRVITVREAARLHSYPDWFRFHVTKWHGFRQIGNSVPPLLARMVASKIREAMNFPCERPAEPQGEEFLRFDMSEAAAYFALTTKPIKTRIRGAVDPAPIKRGAQRSFV
jgi:DNA (cytosine-5)-methyltransferase 1